MDNSDCQFLLTLGALSQSCALLRLVRTLLAGTGPVCSVASVGRVVSVVSAELVVSIASLSTGYSLASRTASAASAGTGGEGGARSELDHDARERGKPVQ